MQAVASVGTTHTCHIFIRKLDKAIVGSSWYCNTRESRLQIIYMLPWVLFIQLLLQTKLYFLFFDCDFFQFCCWNAGFWSESSGLWDHHSSWLYSTTQPDVWTTPGWKRVGLTAQLGVRLLLANICLKEMDKVGHRLAKLLCPQRPVSTSTSWIKLLLLTGWLCCEPTLQDYSWARRGGMALYLSQNLRER